ncbi:hypothetical protein [Candidatus Bathycorpusculum sp.]|jgi:hypothetical protein|uniref:hypothetical protein n=1 Tax=Candidatus Bathycorpusculum sp. TaxID=2994959 RepID=UPI002834D1F2|nr:hypothetical protein [Candidatus Termitimicrobium sp.]MCL2684962.1 hypothetical protein [Candidatus Termitimicrobium sp.]
MDFVEFMIGEKLREADPALDIMGSDHTVLQVAFQDFTNYLKFRWDLVGQEVKQPEILERINTLSQKDLDELDAFLAVWCNMWFKKWKERVKLLIGNQGANKWNKMNKPLADAEPIWRKIECKQDLQELIVATLIKNGEICGTDILAENLLKMELSEKYLQSIPETDRIFVALNNTLRKARAMAHSRGPLIFVKVDKGYYNTPE